MYFTPVFSYICEDTHQTLFMITRHPLGRQDLRIKHRDKVLEIGPGHDPMFRSDVIADKFPRDNTHRCGKVLIYPHQLFVEADGEQLPFGENSFDYVICNQVLEHADNPARFIEEIIRVGKRGYIETPSMLGELMFPKESHRWVILLIDDKLVFYEKAKMPGNYQNNYGEVFLNYLPYQSLPYKMLYVSEPNLMLNRIEWEGSIDYLVNPEDDYYSSFFTRKWDREMTMKIFPPRGGIAEISRTVRASYYLIREKIGQKIRKRPAPITLDEYLTKRDK